MTDAPENLNAGGATGEPAPTEPFACPECGQMLGASCRVCVACKAPVDYGRITKGERSPPLILTRTAAPAAPDRVRFSWSIFFTVLFAYLLAALLSTSLLGQTRATFAMGGGVLLSALWVFADGRERGIPKPMVWSLGCLLMWLVMFPWYLSRRRTPQLPCPIVDGKAGPIARVLLFAIVAFILTGAVLMVLNGPPPK